MGEKSTKVLSQKEYLDVQTLLLKWKNVFRAEELFALKWAFVIGLFSHMFVYVNHYPAYSGLYSFLIDEPSTFLWQGRFLTPIISSLDGQATLPWVLGLTASFLWAMVALCVTRIFELTNRFNIFVISAMIVTFPVVAACNTYLYMADIFSCASMFACLGVLAWKKGSKIKYCIISILCYLGCLALYQPMLSIAITCIVLMGAFRIIAEENVWDTVKQLIRAVMCLLLAVAIWYGIYYMIQVVTNNSGNTIGTSLSISTILYGAFMCYRNAKWLLFDGTYFATSVGRVVVIGTLLAALLEGIIFIKRMLKSNLVWRIIILIALVVIFPLSACYVFLQMPTTDVVSRLFMAYSLVFVLPLILADYNSAGRDEKETVPQKNRRILAGYLATIIAFISIAFFVVTDNTAYMNAYMSYEKEYSFAVRLVDRIETHPDYEEGMQIMIISSGNRKYNGNEQPAMLSRYIVGMEQDGNDFLIDIMSIRAFIKQYIHADLNIKWIQTDEAIKEELTIWPDNDCIKVIDGVMYIKIS